VHRLNFLRNNVLLKEQRGVIRGICLLCTVLRRQYFKAYFAIYFFHYFSRNVSTKKSVHMYVNVKMIPVKITPGIAG
jgi:hypothetical protein